MTAEHYLGQLIYLDQQINSDVEELCRLKQMMTSLPSPNTEGQITGKGMPSSKVESVIVKLVALEESITDEIDTLVDLKAEAWSIIQQLPSSQQRLILQGYYLNRQTIEEIAIGMGLSSRRISAVKKEGLKAVQRLLDKNILGAS